MKPTSTGHRAPSFKARDYLFIRSVMAESLINAGLKPKTVTYSRIPKLAVNGRCISADFKRKA